VPRSETIDQKLTRRIASIHAIRGLQVRIQMPEDGGLAKERNDAQVCVTTPDGEVRAYCGPTGTEETMQEAALFSACPELFMACVEAMRYLEKPSGKQRRDKAQAALLSAISRTLADVQLVTFEARA
jgi:hypothetical protein